MNLAADSGEGQQDPYTREVLEGECDRAVPVQTAYDLVALSAERQPAGLAIADVAAGMRMTYADLVRRAEALAAGLAARGIRPGMLVATVLSTTTRRNAPADQRAAEVVDRGLQNRERGPSQS